jgi:hypothetical protein
MNLAVNNHLSANFNTLLLYLLTQLKFMRLMAYDQDCQVQVYNTMFLIRAAVKYFVQHLNKLQIHGMSFYLITPEHFEMDRITTEASPSSPDKQFSGSPLDIDPQVADGSISSPYPSDKKLRAESLLEELFHILIYCDPSSSEQYWDFYMESLNLLIVLFSSQLYPDKKSNYFIDIAVNRLGKIYAKGLIVKLVVNFCEDKSPPSTGGGVLFNAYSYLFSSSSGGNTGAEKISRKSVMLMLLLVNQINDGNVNEFRDVLLSLMDSDGLNCQSNYNSDSAYNSSLFSRAKTV